MNLERYLVLNRFLHSLFGADRFDDLRRALQDQEEGRGPDGHSRFFHVLNGRAGLDSEMARRLPDYDLRIMDYEERLARKRRAEPFRTFKYFQYLALLYTEIYLDYLTTNPARFLQRLNAFRAAKRDFADIPDFQPDDLRRLAFFMATGSGKTLILHVNIWQVLHYLKIGKHPEMLVRRSDGRAEFDNILLITPGEGLSSQHLHELEDSGLEAGRFDRRVSGGLFGPRVQVIEIHKLAEEPTGEGVSVPLAELGTRNLVIVDEGHKGAGSEARTWKTRQETLSRDGFLLEYSATFAQAIGAAAPKVRRELLGHYSKSILFDYSYRYFYGDGYGKAFRVLNLKEASADKAHELMLGGLLIFYQQVLLYQQQREEARAYNIEKPLWVLLGTSVSRKRPDEKDYSKAAAEERTDVGEVVAFLRRFLEEPDWAVERIGRTIAGQSGFSDSDSGNDLFERHLRFLAREDASALYERICRDLFHGRGGLEVVEVRQSGEIGLRVSAPAHRELPYFGLINIGDVPDFKRYLEANHGITVKEDVISDALFNHLSRADSPIYMLIGARKFIEGWSSWRVSAMGLLRIGQGEGSQVIQLFGRGVRLKGKDKSLKRSHTLAGAPAWLETLETLYIVGWKADYLQAFRDMLAREDLAQELPPLRVQQNDIPEWALVPRTRPGFDPSTETWVLDSDAPLRVKVDLVPQVVSLASEAAGASEGAGTAGRPTTILPATEPYRHLLDLDRLHAELLEYKAARGYRNVFIPRQAVCDILASRCEVRLSDEEARDPERVRVAVSRALKTYLDRFVRLREREAESRNAEPAPLVRERQVVSEYRITVHVEGAGARLLVEIEALLRQPPEQLLRDAGEPLPRLYLDWHLFNPLLVEGDVEWRRHVTVNPPALVRGERQLVEHLRSFWASNKDKEHYSATEVCLLRNLPKVGVGIFARSGFYPDFILWIRNRMTGALRVVFLDPHGLHHEGLEGNDRFEAIKMLRILCNDERFRSRKIDLDGFILIPAGTSLDVIPGAAGMTWAELENSYPVLRQDENGIYIHCIFAGGVTPSCCARSK